MTKQYPYYDILIPIFPVSMKLCFSNEDFQHILKDHAVPAKATALDTGIAETHFFNDGKQTLIVLAFDLSECDDSPSGLFSTVVHESVHAAARVFDAIGEEEPGEEIQCYLTEYIAVQTMAGIVVHKEKHARKTSRKVPVKKGKGTGRTDVQVDLNSDGSSRQNSVPEGSVLLSGTQDANRSTVTKTNRGV